MERFDLKKFCSTVEKNKITYAYVVPPVILQLINSPHATRHNLRSLRMLMSAAAPLSVEIIDILRTQLGLKVRQAYGLSETSPTTHMQVGIPDN
jgi:acyl-coenzyme A synthetase/AMP-(fatty) acid ligase